jgi:hypothetical protein
MQPGASVSRFFATFNHIAFAMKLSPFLTSLTAVLAFSSSAQKFEWSKRFGGAQAEIISHIACDSQGNVWSAGSYTDTVYYQIAGQDFMLVSPGNEDGLLMRHSPSGVLLWVGTLSGVDQVRFTGVSPMSDGGAVACGIFRQSVMTGAGLSTVTATSNGLSDGFIVRFDAAGQVLWLQSFGGSGFDNAWSLTVNESGEIWTVGSFHETVDFDPGTGEFLMTSAGSSDAFVLRLSGDGQFISALRFGGDDWDVAQSVAQNASGDLIIAGHFSTTADFNPGPGVVEMTSLSGYDGFVLSISENGDFQWVRQFGGNGDDRAHHVAIHPDQSILVTGDFTNNLIFDSEIPSLTLNSQGSTDAFIARLSDSGEVLWNQRFGGVGADRGRAVVADGDGNIYWTGFFSETAHFGPVSNGVSLVSAGNIDAFVFKINIANEPMWKRRAGGNAQDSGQAICTDSDDKIIIGGMFQDQGGWHPAWPNNQMTSAGNSDAFLWKMSDCGGTGFGEAYHFSCGQSLNINGQNFNQPGIYEQNLFTPQGCDTLVTLTIDFFVVDPTILLNAGMFTALPNYDSYQWVLCNNGSFTPIEGQTEHTFTPLDSGVYAVQISNGPCSEVSECVTFTNLQENSRPSAFLPYPNPSSGEFSLDLRTMNGLVRLVIADASGRMVEEREFSGGAVIGFRTPLPAGVYSGSIISSNQADYFRLIIRK